LRCEKIRPAGARLSTRAKADADERVGATIVAWLQTQIGTRSASRASTARIVVVAHDRARRTDHYMAFFEGVSRRSAPPRRDAAAPTHLTRT
jgi:hypothetical protein